MMYGLTVPYNPYSPHAPQQATHAPDVPQSRLTAAERAGATHLSGDGLKCYRDDRGGIEVAFWDNETGEFPSWWGCEALPAGAAVLK